MRIAFYAPMKPPDHPVPSGDRRVARLLIRALEHAGDTVELASRCRAYEGSGDAVRQAGIRAEAEAEADAIIARWRGRDGQRPDIWLTYHLYHKAPDWIGPRVAGELGIPYAVAEASHAPKQRDGPWSLGFDGALTAIRAASLVIAVNPVDTPCVRAVMADGARLLELPAFLDTTPYRTARLNRAAHRNRIAAQYGMGPNAVWLLTVAMMRPGDKQTSYEILGKALADLSDGPWSMLVAGDGDARKAVETALGSAADRVRYCGAINTDDLPALYAASDIYVWPAVNEAYGMAFLEAQATGLPVVAGREGGVESVVAPDASILVPPRDAGALARAVRELLDDPVRRQAMGERAARNVDEHHGLEQAARALHAALSEIAS